MKEYILFMFLLLGFFQCSYNQKVYCDSIDIKDERDLKNITDCNIIIGYVRLINIDVTDFLNLASAVEEVTDYVLVYRVGNIVSLGQIFPNLTIIRGQNLLFDQYALVVYENTDIRDLGLKSLLKIRKGSIKIESNPVLCFIDTVNWVYLVENHTTQNFYFKNNLDPNECTLCLQDDKRSEIDFLKNGCWNLKDVQRKKPIPHLKDCPDQCGTNGCSHRGKCCSPLCLTGCLSENCHICKNFKTLKGHCVENCYFPFYALADQCLTENECRQKGFIPHGGACLRECPKNFRQEFVDGIAQCNIICERNFTIYKKDDLQEVKECTTIRGSLHIELRDEKSNHIISELESCLGAIKEITGSLKIIKSPQLTTLGFFKKLDTIRGDSLLEGEVAFWVVDNFHLEEIWAENHNVAIFKGRIFFHLNPRLCYDKILKLAPSIRSYDEITVRDASHNSNGERVICGNDVYLLKTIVEDVNATAARIKLEPLASFDRIHVLGYLHYYKEAPSKNITEFDTRHGCGRDDWNMRLYIGSNIRYLYQDLKPNTQYAYNVKTFTMVDYIYSKAHFTSGIQYFKTLPMKPGPIYRMYSTPFSSTSIIVHWWPPKGTDTIEKYCLRYEPLNKHINHSQAIGYKYTSGKFEKKCEFGTVKSIRGGAPNDLSYYNMNQVIFNDAILNFVFVSRTTYQRIEEELRMEDLSRRKRARSNSFSSESISLIQSCSIRHKIKKYLLLEGSSRRRRQISNSPIIGNLTSNTSITQEQINDEADVEMKLNMHSEEEERKSLLEQDTGISDFLITHPPKVCEVSNSSKEYQKENKCVPLEIYNGIHVSGTTHSYTFDNLEPDSAYKIFVRACVGGMQNPCGPESSIESRTLSESVEYFLRGP